MDELTYERYPYDAFELAAERFGRLPQPPQPAVVAELERSARLRVWRLRREAQWLPRLRAVG